MAVAGTLVWVVRIVASVALQQEAMGFGDVTLMGMIGAFLGWQPAVMAFFLAPFAGVVIALAQWLTTGRKEIAYGPFLCQCHRHAARLLAGNLERLGAAPLFDGDALASRVDRGAGPPGRDATAHSASEVGLAPIRLMR